MPTWFLLPDFTFSMDGPLRMGMVIPHWSRSTTVLADVGAEGEIKLPAIKTITERNHVHNHSTSQSDSLSLWSTFESLASASASVNTGESKGIDYSKTDHEVRFFADPLMPDTAAAVAKLPVVRAHIDSGIFGKRPVYIVSGLRIATSSFTATKESRYHFSATAEGSANPVGGYTPMDAGGNVKHDSRDNIADSYDTAPGIIFAYRLNVIRTRRAGVETELFQHKGAFLTGSAGESDAPLIVVEATKDEIDEDLEEEVEYETMAVGEDGMCIYLPRS